MSCSFDNQVGMETSLVVLFAIGLFVTAIGEEDPKIDCELTIYKNLPSRSTGRQRLGDTRCRTWSSMDPTRISEKRSHIVI